MKNRIGNPDFIVRLTPNEEKVIIHLANDFQKDSYAKTLISVALTYETDKRNAREINMKLKQQVIELTKKLTISERYNKQLNSKIKLFSELVNKVADIKTQLRKILPAHRSPRK